MVIAIDGPAGAGKSTVAKALAKEYSIVYLDTGAMYRAVGLYVLRKNIDLKDIEGIKNVLDDIKIDIEHKNEKQIVLLNKEDVSGLIRTPEVSMAASCVATVKEVRIKLVEEQRRIAGEQDIVMDGRDIGTYVLPNAQYKFYITATAKERAKRRYQELKQKGQNADIDKLEDEIIKRDYQDKNRDFAPLKKACDAIEVDTTDMSISEVINEIKNKIKGNC